MSLLVEPISLLLMPGLLVSLAAAGPHDYKPNLVAIWSFVFYFIFFYVATGWFVHHRAR